MVSTPGCDGAAPGQAASQARWRARAVTRRMAAVAGGLVLDQCWGEPPDAWHPVARFGQAMEWLETRWWADGRAKGSVHALVGTGAAATVGWLSERCLGPTKALVVATTTASAGHALFATAIGVAVPLHAGDMPAARSLLRALVGRDPSDLDELEIARAVVESVAENLSDAVVATALWGLVGGARGALVHRAANTLDAMVGHRSDRYRRFGWASARLDDLLGWPSARLTAVLVALAVPSRARQVLLTVRRDAPAHPSPNAGVAEAAFAGALGVRLGGTNRYGSDTEHRPILGSGRPCEPRDIARAVQLARKVVALLVASLVATSLVGNIAGRRVAQRLGGRP